MNSIGSSTQSEYQIGQNNQATEMQTSPLDELAHKSSQYSPTIDFDLFSRPRDFRTTDFFPDKRTKMDEIDEDQEFEGEPPLVVSKIKTKYRYGQVKESIDLRADLKSFLNKEDEKIGHVLDICTRRVTELYTKKTS